MPADASSPRIAARVSGAIKLSGVGVDCPSAAHLAAFYAEITGGTVTEANGHWASMSGPGGSIDFWSVPHHQPPTWPNGPTPKQMRLDFSVDDLEATEARVLVTGAVKYEVQSNSDHCYVCADPDGHPFCLSTWGNPAAKPVEGARAGGRRQGSRRRRR